MKRLLLFIIISCFSFAANAQQDSILVVIECDSVYRPFLEHAGRVEVFDYSKTNLALVQVRLDSVTSFQVPLSIDTNRFSLFVNFGVIGGYLTGILVDYNSKGYIRLKMDYSAGTYPKPDRIAFKDKPVIKIQIPIDTTFDKYLIDNTCSGCGRNDNISWIQYGLPVENPITGKLEMGNKFFNPYNNPFILPHYLGGCSPMPYHWYCHRCKKEY